MDTPRTKDARSARRWWILLAIVGALVAAFVALRSSGRRQLQAAIDRIAIEGQALTSAALPSPKNAGKPDPFEWFVRVGRSRPAWTLADLSDPKRYAFLLDEARSKRLGEDARVAFEAFEAELRPYLGTENDTTAKWNELWIGMAVRLRDCDGVRPFGALKERAVSLLAVGLDAQMKLARQAANYGLIDPVRETASLEDANASFPKLPYLEEATLADAVHITAIHHAQAHDPGAAIDTLRTGFAMARIHSSPRWLMSEMMWNLQMMRVLDGLQTILPLLPRGLDLSDIERELTEARPREVTAQAIRGERAFGYRVLERFDEGGTLADDGIFARSSVYKHLIWPVVSARDRAAYLDALTDAALRAEQSRYLRKPAPDGVPMSFWTPISSALAPQLEPSLLSTDHLEARLLLARVALIAYRAGAKDALEFLPKTTDPFDGRPIRCGLGDEGLVVFWSSGPDGKDGGALPDTDDITWGLKLAE